MTLPARTTGTEIDALLAPHLPRRRRVVSVARRPSPNRSSFFVDELDVHLNDGSTLALLAKAVQWDAMDAAARRAKPIFLWHPERERTTYESLLSQFPLGTAQYLGSFAARDGIRYLLLERLDGIPLWQCERFDAWRSAALWLARLHTSIGATCACRSEAGPHLLIYDRGFFDQWLRRAIAFQTGSVEEMRVLARHHDAIVHRLLELPRTFIHGEFYAANVVVAAGAQGAESIVRPVDWETAAIGPGLVDLACLLAGRWTDDERADVADIYFRELARRGVDVPPREQYLMDLDFCLVHLSIRNLGWSRDWVPPADRVHDWLGDALRLCAKWLL
jgi:hypothetical protein